MLSQNSNSSIEIGIYDGGVKEEKREEIPVVVMIKSRA